MAWFYDEMNVLLYVRAGSDIEVDLSGGHCYSEARRDEQVVAGG